MTSGNRMVQTICPYCGVGCNIQLHIKDEMIYRVTSPYDSVVNRGNLCVKGRFGYDYIYNKDRVTSPLVRKDKQKPGKRTQAFERSEWQEVSWETVLGIVADGLVDIYLSHGSDALAAYCCAKATNEDNYLMQKMFRSLFRTNNIDHCTRLCHAGSVVALQMAVGSSAMSNTASEVTKNEVFILTGTNTAETHPIIAIQMKAAVEKFGAKLIVVDPRRVEMVDWAELWLSQKPGTDVPVFSAMAHIILKENLYNQAFIDERTEGFQEFASAMEKFTPEYAESISGVDRQLIVQAARLYATAKTGAIYWALGIPEHSHGTDNALSLINLAFLTGHIGREGTGLNPLRGQNNVQGASDAGAMPWHYPGYQPVDNEESAQKFEKGWHVEPGGLNRQRGLTTTEIVNHIGPDGVRSLYVMGENPMMSEPNLNHTREKIMELEFMVVQDLFINETGAFADVILPAVSFAEKDGTFTNTDRRVQRVVRALPPRGQSRPDWEIICNIARLVEKRLSRTESAYWDYQHPSEIMAEMAGLVPEYSGINYSRIEKIGLQTPVWDDLHAGTPYLFANSFPRGRGKFHPLIYKPSAELPDEEYPFILTTGRVLEQWHGGTLTRHSWMDDLYPEALMELNPSDSVKLNINESDPVRVTSRRATIILRTKVTQKTNPGIVFIPFFFSEAAVNLLTNDVIDPIAKIPEYKICAVKIEKATVDELKNPSAHQSRGRY